jgi:hypothetical protein
MELISSWLWIALELVPLPVGGAGVFQVNSAGRARRGRQGASAAQSSSHRRSSGWEQRLRHRAIICALPADTRLAYRQRPRGLRGQRNGQMWSCCQDVPLREYALPLPVAVATPYNWASSERASHRIPRPFWGVDSDSAHR